MSGRILEGLQPERVFYYFEEISRIPRPSFKEKAISDYLVEFAKAHGLSCEQDEYYNVIIFRPASPGYEDCEPVILQGHMDMVCEKEPDCRKDMDREGLDLFVDGDFIGARGTTLGGDDGIAVAIALALLEDETLSAPRLEFVCTSCEESGMEGASHVDLSSCQGRRLINIDSEEELVLTAGCAGGGRFSVTMPIRRVREDAGEWYALRISGLTGGHSGQEIHKGRANANVLMVQLLRHISQKMSLSLASFSGGDRDNVIPRESYAVFSVSEGTGEPLREMIQKETSRLKNEYLTTDPEMSIVLEPFQGTLLEKGQERADEEFALISPEDTGELIRLMLSMPNGVVRMQDLEQQIVETSLNFGIVQLEQDTLHLGYLLRSVDAGAYEALRENMRFMAEGFGATVEVRGEYPAWEFQKESPLREALSQIYEEQNQKSLSTFCIHAGLECGILLAKLPGLDAVSIGPDIFDIHTPDERLSIASVGREYRLIREFLKRSGDSIC